MVSRTGSMDRTTGRMTIQEPGVAEYEVPPRMACKAERPTAVPAV